MIGPIEFTTPPFLLFLSIIFALYWLARSKGSQNLVLVTSSYLFYASWDSRFGLLLLATSLIDFGVGLGLARAKTAGRRRALLGLSVCAGLGTLGFFKYFNFFLQTFGVMAKIIGWHTDPFLVKILLPVGISFYTLKSLSYTIDVYRGQIEPTNDLIEYMAYVAFFPQLLAGPIDRAANLLKQLQARRRFSYPLAVDGCRQILWGLFKKMVLADSLAPIVNLVYAQAATRSGPHLAFATVCFAFQIYCDFSAYSDIAMGAGKLLGLDSLPNFYYPYFAHSPAEFWRRWHISLMTWFRDYVFFPLGGVRGSGWRKVFNVVLTFVLSGLWHGASFHFLAWGGINGVGILPSVLWRGPRRSPLIETNRLWKARFRSAFKILLTFGFICLTWIFFRSPDLFTAVLILKRLLLGWLNFTAYSSLWQLVHPYPEYPLAGAKLIIFLSSFVVAEWLLKDDRLNLNAWPRSIRWFAYNSLIFLIFYFGTYSVSQFYYYQF